ncbi:MAG TPA: uroporphyrinogen-III C-methyltransferase [Acidobacteriaceae bacterium]|jgi:uroporphyrin-III C-methyltransferase|nr:uroporphyrinogen-III C-methyltransferase [Acidobacteriaceae bacterium]
MTTAHPATVYLVGAGPGDPELLTLKAVRLLATADVVLHDDLVPQAVLAHAASAIVINVGKRCGRKNISQDQIDAMMVDYARRGLSVVRLKCGDPLVFGRAGEEMDALSAANIPFEVVPGITAAFAAAAALRRPLTDRRSASSISFSSGHHAPGSDLQPASLSGATRVVYMPGRDLSGIAAQLRREDLAADLPCVVVSRAAQPDQHVVRTTLADLHRITPGPAPAILLAGEALRDARQDAIGQFTGDAIATSATELEAAE